MKNSIFSYKCLEVSFYLSTFAADKNLIANELYR